MIKTNLHLININNMENIDLNKFKLDRSKNELSAEEIAYLDTLSNEDVIKLINYHDKQYNYYNAMQDGKKLALNSIYGAFGNDFFVCSNKDIAGAITAMGRDAIKYMDKIAEEYSYNYWHIDEELHAKLGINTEDVTPIDHEWIHRESRTLYDGIPTQDEIDEGIYQRRTPVQMYIDTDSGFFSFQPLMDSCKWKGDPQSFIFTIARERLEPLFKKKLDNYAKKYKVKNLQDFELENVNESILFLAKKKYIKHTLWEDNVISKRLETFVAKNVNIMHKSTPTFCRDKIYNIVKYIFDKHDSYSLKDMLKFVKDIKKEFSLANIEDLSKSTGVNSYHSSKIIVDGNYIDGPGIVDDKTSLKFGSNTYYTVKAAGYYNYLLNQHPELQSKYEFIKPGTRIKYYYCKSDINERFAFPIGEFPKEFAPEMDIDEQFLDTVTDQVNIYIKALGLPELNKRLSVIMPLF